MKKIFSLFIAAGAFLISSCNDEGEKEDLVTGVNKKGSVETAVSVKALDSSRDLLTTKHIVWNHDTIFKTIEYYDTIPALGMEKKEVNNNGSTQVIAAKKEYEIFITVK
ncbi:MAG: hypothetical protein WAT19_13995 [Ferruginibacter sp.]